MSPTVYNIKVRPPDSPDRRDVWKLDGVSLDWVGWANGAARGSGGERNTTSDSSVAALRFCNGSGQLCRGAVGPGSRFMAGNRLKMALGETATKSSRKRAASSSEDAAEKDAAEGECKRTKLPPPGRTIRDALPDSLVAAVCDFLTVPSRLMTALALGGRNGGSIGGTAV
ncbi:hypothetical protein THAOC_26159, partial [Thalassiosira oceanica]